MKYFTIWLVAFAAFVSLSAFDARQSSAQDGPQGIFPDKNLESVVRRYVFDKRYTEDPITEEDVKYLSVIKGVDAGVTGPHRFGEVLLAGGTRSARERNQRSLGIVRLEVSPERLAE
ncbi:MAG: hypothetical protein R3B96_20600 [Pirellulaceae bacterium]